MISEPSGNNVRKQRFSKKNLATAIGSILLSTSAIAETTLEEVVVTATRRATSVQDIPYNISAIGGEALQRVGATGLNDVVRMVPGLASADTGQRQSINSTLILRGVNANNPGRNSITQNMTDPAVSMYIDDVPMYFNVNVSDVERVEVLRGPQGTLYGSGSVGGTLRFILNKPSTEETMAKISARLGANEESDELNYSTDFIGNLPLSETAAIRVNAGYKKLGGVTDANGLLAVDANGMSVLSDPADVDSPAVVLPTKEDTDEMQSWYVRGALLWNISDEVDAVVTLIHQEDEGDGDTFGQITDGDTKVKPWEHTLHRLVPAEFENDMVSVDISADLGFATFTSATGYFDSQQDMVYDNSGLYANLSGLYFGYPIEQISAPSFFDMSSEVITQEFRLVSQGEGAWDWVVGAWYRDQEQEANFNDKLPGYKRWASDPTSYGSQITQAYYGLNTVADFWAIYYQGGTSTPVLDDPYVQKRVMEFEDIAVFGELTYHITDEWQVTGGFRQFWQDFTQDNAIDFNILGPGFAVRTNSEAEFEDAIFKLNTSYDLTDDMMVYFTWAEGFRHGGANGFPTSGPNGVDPALLEYEADEADNYEIGIKGTLLENRLRYTVAAFMINWDSPQLDVFLGPLSVPSVLNGEEARTQGLESEFTAQFTDNLSMTFGYSYTEAELTKDFAVPGTGRVGQDGDDLPGVPKHQASVALNYFQPLDGGSEMHYYLSGSYRSKATTGLNGGSAVTASFQDFAEVDSFSLWNLGANWVSDGMSVGFYVNNVTNEEGMTGVRIDRPDFSDRGYVTRPRSYGISFSYTFE